MLDKKSLAYIMSECMFVRVMSKGGSVCLIRTQKGRDSVYEEEKRK